MFSVTIYFKDRETELTINNVVNILAETTDPHEPFQSVLPEYLFFDDDKKYIFNAGKHKVFIRGSAIQCASIIRDE